MCFDREPTHPFLLKRKRSLNPINRIQSPHLPHQPFAIHSPTCPMSMSQLDCDAHDGGLTGKNFAAWKNFFHTIGVTHLKHRRLDGHRKRLNNGRLRGRPEYVECRSTSITLSSYQNTTYDVSRMSPSRSRNTALHRLKLRIDRNLGTQIHS